MDVKILTAREHINDLKIVSTEKKPLRLHSYQVEKSNLCTRLG